MQKKGQMTLLIILGLVIVVSVIMIFVFKDNLFSSDWETQRALSLTVPDEAEEIHSYILDCVEETITEPVELMGVQGGYLQIPNDPIGRGTHNPLSNSFEIFQDTDFETAYWYYKSANGISKNQVPTIESMEEELANYVDQNLADCTDDFEMFEKYNASVGELSTEVEILDDEVRFIVDYPVTIALDDFVFDFEKFYESVDVPLGGLYNSATEIMDEENENFWLEELTYDMFVLYDEVPLADQEFNCEQQTWEYDQVEEDLKEIIMQNVLAIKVVGTEYDISEETDKAYFEWDALDSSTDYSANLYYSTNWPIEFQAYPLEDGELVEDTYSGLNGPGAFLRNIFCLTEYQFIYDLKYPVLVTLHDPDSGYNFQFATMVVLDNNQPRENENGILDSPDVEGTICENPTVPITVYTSTITDSGAYQNIEADVSFKCINSLCQLGETRGGSDLEAVVPACVNAQIIAEADGYAKAVETVTTIEESTVSLTLEEYYELSYDIKVVDTEGNVESLQSDDTAIITLIEKNTGETITVTSPSNEETVVLAAGEYEISGQLVTDSSFDITIPAQSYEKCTSVPLLSLSGIFGLDEDTSCIEVEGEEQKLDTVFSGSLSIDWDLDRDELAGAEHVTFYVLSPGEPENEEELDDLYSYLEYGIGQKEPELK